VNGLRFLSHLIVSTLGVILLASLSTFTVIESLHPIFPNIGLRTASWILTETPYFPVQIVTGLLMGFQSGRRYAHKVMLWTWVVPALLMAFMIRLAPLRPVVVSGVELTPIQHFFGGGCLPQNHCFEQVGFTLLLYASLAYSAGAIVARVIPLPSGDKAGDGVRHAAP
jgi:hypothetical protein